MLWELQNQCISKEKWSVVSKSSKFGDDSCKTNYRCSNNNVSHCLPINCILIIKKIRIVLRVAKWMYFKGAELWKENYLRFCTWDIYTSFIVTINVDSIPSSCHSVIWYMLVNFIHYQLLVPCHDIERVLSDDGILWP